jgi:hypothetical protein
VKDIVSLPTDEISYNSLSAKFRGLFSQIILYVEFIPFSLEILNDEKIGFGKYMSASKKI